MIAWAQRAVEAYAPGEQPSRARPILHCRNQKPIGPSCTADHTVEWLVALGYPQERPLSPVEHIDRRPFDEVVHRERF